MSDARPAPAPAGDEPDRPGAEDVGDVAGDEPDGSGGQPPGTMCQSASSARFEPDGGDQGPAGRFWSERRVPAVLAAAVLLLAAGALLYDLVSVRADRSAAAWRRDLAEELATRRLDDGWVIAASVAAMLLGVWLITLALTPGLRRLLPMREDGEAMRAGIERAAVAMVLRARAMEVAGVRSVRVAVGRRRVRVLAEAGFRELDVVRADLDAVLDRGIQQLGLARRPALSVHVRRPPKP